MKHEVKVIIGIVVVAVAILVLGAFVFSKNAGPEALVNTKPVPMDILVKETSHMIGDASIPVTLVEFADFECPACAYAHPMIKRILAEYEGKINFVYRNFPLDMHVNAKLAANAAEAAGEQGKYWEMSDKLFEGQQTWGGKQDSKLAKETFIQYATELGLDVKRFTEVLEKGTYDAVIAADQKDGDTAGVRGTPTFFLNGKKIEGGVPRYEALKKLIDVAIEDPAAASADTTPVAETPAEPAQ